MHHPEARSALTDLVYAVDEFESSSAVDALKQLSPETLMERVKARDARAINDVARNLGELGPHAREALPDLIAKPLILLHRIVQLRKPVRDLHPHHVQLETLSHVRVRR